MKNKDKKWTFQIPTNEFIENIKKIYIRRKYHCERNFV